MFRQNQMLNSIVEKGKKISSTKLSIFYFHNMVQKKTEILFLFTTVYAEPSKEYAFSKYFSNKSFQHRLGHKGKHQSKVWVCTRS